MGSESKHEGEVMQIPAASKKVVQNIKEIVNKNCTDAEIYSVLCDFNMDADAAVQNLLNQDPFHQVKSKRERRKEMKETLESMARGNNNGYHGAKAGVEYNVGRVSCQISNNDPGTAAYRKENGSVAHSGPSPTLIYRVKMTNEQPSFNNDFCNADDRRQAKATEIGDTILSSAHLSSGTQVAWSGGTTGNVSMADIVRMGRLRSKGSQNMDTSCTPQDVVGSVNSSQDCHKSSCDSSPSPPEMHQFLQCPHPTQVPETIHESGVAASSHDELPVFEQQTAVDHQSEKVQVSDRDAAKKNPGSYCAESAFSCRRQENVNTVVGDSHGGDCLVKDKTYDSQSCMNDNREGTGSGFQFCFPNFDAPLNDEVSSAAVNLQQLSLGKEEPALPSSDDKHAVVFPDYMQAFAVDWPHLSFGTYKSGGSIASTPVKTNLVETSAAANSSSALCKEIRHVSFSLISVIVFMLSWLIISPDFFLCRNPEHLQDEQLRSISDTHRFTAGVGINNMYVYSQQELMRQNIHEVSHRHKYNHPSSVPDSNLKKTLEQDCPSGVRRIHPQARNLSSLHMELQASATTIPMDIFTSTIQSSRDSDYASSFLGTQSMPSRFDSAVSSTGNPAISQSEIPSRIAFSLPMSCSTTLPSANLVPQTTLSQHLPANLYAQSTVSLEELTNLTGYPSMPQNYSRNPTAFQQAYQDNTMFHDSLSNMGYSYAQYKTGASRSNLPLSDVNISGYGGLGIPGNFPGAILQAAAPTGSAGGYDIFHSQYQERNNFITHQQNNVSSRTMSALPDNGYLTLTGQSQLLSGNPQGQQQRSQDHMFPLHTHNYQQGQQLSQNYGAPFHANPYHSQARIRPEQPRQSLGDHSLSSSQGLRPSNYNDSGSRATYHPIDYTHHFE
ncbi:RNA polymerase II DEGRADATION FACTOR-LIKE PROTEIN (DUF1296) [Salix purpurea]|uniref:RNA polymerase II DEGRADATION FACTOR-LIKE PROTEIN (DUF1296) n=1 Tax=Salix purpurea TaxID=77065 RepID=A0A9Q0SPN8_SALPP|nr:RNA polymerase II DEGRADATION FACTOR-LIKE PROTEIN (DUF1296) [Salix purpurea]